MNSDPSQNSNPAADATISGSGTGISGSETGEAVTNAPTLIEVKKLGKRYGDFDALEDCTLSIQSGEVFGLLGPNGAGKTTLMRCLLGFIRATSGQATIGGFDVWHQRQQAHQLLSYMPAQPQLPRLLRGRDVLRFFADIRPDADFERACQLADRLKLDLKRWVALMSTGMRQKLAIAATLCSSPQLVFMDEPTANLDPDVRDQLLTELAELKAKGTTVLFSSHVLSEIEQVCDRVAVLARGNLVGITSIGDMKRGSVIRGRCENRSQNVFEKLAANWQADRFQIQTTESLENLLPDLLAAGVKDLRIETLGLADVYRQHLSYQPEHATISGAES